MLHVSIGDNVLDATLDERASVASLFYDIKVTSTEHQRDPKTVRLVNLSVPGNRMNKVSLKLVSEQSEEDLPGNKIFLTGGDYLYEISDQTGKILERGFLRFDTTKNQKTYTNNNVTVKVYNG